MKNRSHLILTLLLGGVMLSGCLGGGSGSSGGNGDQNGDGGDGSGGGGNGGSSGNGDIPEDGLAPEDTDRFARALMLDYATAYSGDTDWAIIDASYNGDPDQQPQRMAVDVSMLGSALASALHYMDNQVLEAGGGDDEIYDSEFHELLGFEDCQTPGNTTIADNSITFQDSCVVVTALDDREIVLNGEVTWQEDPGAIWPAPAGEPTRLLDFENLEVDWKGQRFVMNGAMADEPSAITSTSDPDAKPGGLLHMVWDATQEGAGRTFRFARRFQNTLVAPGVADDLAYHPGLGATATLISESWYAGDACDGGGIEDVALRLSSGTLEDELAVGLPGCDAYFFAPEFASANLDSSGVQIRPELYRLLASIDMAEGNHTERTLDADQDDHYELAAQAGPHFLEPEEVEIGRIGGISGNGGEDTAYQITLSFDPEELASLGSDAVVAGVLRLYAASRGEDGEHSQFYSGRVTQEEWTGEPTDIWIDSGTDASSLTRDREHPWHAAIVTSMVQTTLKQSRSRVQMVVSTLAFPGLIMQEGEYISGICLREGDDCSDEQLPSLMVITEN